jgi:hypothetical protein
MNKLVRGILLTVMLMAATSAFAATPTFMPYQGRLTDAAGTPLNGAQTVIFTFYDDPTAGSTIYSESQSVTCANGLFTAEIGTGTLVGGSPAWSLDVLNGANLYLGIKVGADAEMTPRVHLGVVPFAARSGSGAGLSLNRVVNGSVAVNATAVAAADEIVSTTITTPAFGYILLISSGTATLSASGAGASTYSYFGIGEVGAETGLSFNTATYVGNGNPPNTSFFWTPFTYQRIYAKPAGTYTFSLRAYKGSSTTGCFYANTIITALFIPEAMGGLAGLQQSASIGANSPAPAGAVPGQP